MKVNKCRRENEGKNERKGKKKGERGRKKKKKEKRRKKGEKGEKRKRRRKGENPKTDTRDPACDEEFSRARSARENSSSRRILLIRAVVEFEKRFNHYALIFICYFFCSILFIFV